MTRLAAISLATLSACSLVEPPLSVEERAGIEADLAAAEASIAPHEAVWKAAIAEATGASLPDDPKACPFVTSNHRQLADALGAPDEVADQLRQMRAAQAVFGKSHKAIVRGDLGSARAPRAELMEEEIRKLRDRMRPDRLRYASHPERLVEEARTLADPGWWRWDLTVWIQARKDASNINVDDQRFTAGAVVGRSYLVDYSAERVACVGTFVATHSGTVEFTSQPGLEAGQAYGAAAFDLDANAIQAAETSLVAR